MARLIGMRPVSTAATSRSSPRSSSETIMLTHELLTPIFCPICVSLYPRPRRAPISRITSIGRGVRRAMFSTRLITRQSLSLASMTTAGISVWPSI